MFDSPINVLNKDYASTRPAHPAFASQEMTFILFLWE